MKRTPLKSYRPPPILVLATIGFTFGPGCREQGGMVEFPDGPHADNGPDIEVYPTFVELGPLDIEGCDRIQREITISNLGDGGLEVGELELLGLNSDVTLEPANSFALAPGEYADLTLVFEPIGATQQEGSLLISSNDAYHPKVEVEILAWTVEDTGE